MNYNCPECGRPQLCGRLYRETPWSAKLIDMEVNQKCRACGTSWVGMARVNKKNKIEYDRMEFISINRVETKKTWHETVQEQTLKLKSK